MSEQTTFDINQVIDQVKAVVTNPAGFYQTMPKTGGYGPPVIFVAVMAAVVGLITLVYSIFGAGTAGSFAAGLVAVIVMPIFAVIGAFIGAAILYVIWKLMGSAENYETAFRCQSSVAAIYPVAALLSLFPYIGVVVIAWGAYLLIEASVSVHGRERKTSQIVFGILAALMIISNIASERAARQLEARMERMGSQFQGIEDMSPEEAGRKMGEFFKGLEEGANRAPANQED